MLRNLIGMAMGVALIVTPMQAKAHENIFSVMIKLHDLIHALEQVDKHQLEQAIEQTIINGIKQYEQQKKIEQFESQENSVKKI